MATKAQTKGTDTTREVALPKIQLPDLVSFSDGVSALSSLGIPIATEFPAMGDGFEETPKNALVGVEMILVAWEFRQGDIPNDETGEFGEYVAVRAITRDDRKVYFADGGMGVYSQLRKLTDTTGQLAGLHAKYGLDYIEIRSRANKRSYFLATSPRSDRDA